MKKQPQAVFCVLESTLNMAGLKVSAKEENKVDYQDCDSHSVFVVFLEKFKTEFFSGTSAIWFQ